MVNKLDLLTKYLVDKVLYLMEGLVLILMQFLLTGETETKLTFYWF